jgi:hypothetical protein
VPSGRPDSDYGLTRGQTNPSLSADLRQLIFRRTTLGLAQRVPRRGQMISGGLEQLRHPGMRDMFSPIAELFGEHTRGLRRPAERLSGTAGSGGTDDSVQLGENI